MSEHLKAGAPGKGKDEKALAAFLRELGPSAAVERFLRGYGNVRTRCSYAGHLVLYLRWLRSKGIEMTPDALIQDNLKAVFESAPTDVAAKRKHLDLLAEYVNGYLLNEKGSGDSTRKIATSAITCFYRANDSALFGFWRVAEQRPEAPAPPLHGDDIRRVLLAMPVRTRTPLLLSWQSSIEINRVLEMDWSFALDKTPPVKVELQGRKSHRRAYSTYIGSESVEHLRQITGPMPDYSTVRHHFRFAARKLGAAGLLKNPDLRSWHPHNLRHSFETEAAHAKVPKEIRGFFEGHLADISWVYNHSDAVHPEDLQEAWLKIEPFVSLNPGQTTLREEFEEREKRLLSRIERAESLLAAVRSEIRASPPAPPQAAQAEP